MRIVWVFVISVLLGWPAQAQDFPNRPIRWIVPFAPGGVADVNARVVAKGLSDVLGVAVVVDNKAGAAGIVGTEALLQAPADGYTIMYAPSGIMATHPYLYKKISYDPLRSFSLIHAIAETPLVMVVNANTPVKSVSDFVAFAKAKKDKLNFGSPGVGSSSHLATELFQKESGLEMTHIAYKGSAPSSTDLSAGVLDLSFDNAVVVKPLIEAGKLRALGVTTESRLKNMPDVPTFRESGFPGVVLSSWSIAVAPANVPKDIVDRLSKAFGEAMKRPEVVRYFEDNGSSIMKPLSGAALQDFVVSENLKFKKLVEQSGATPE